MKESVKTLPARECIQINQALFSIVNAYKTRYERENTEKQNKLAISDRGVLMVLGQFEPINSRILSKIMGINPGTISLYVSRLEKRDVIKRERDRNDRRNWWLTLTKKGKAKYKDTYTGAVKYTKDILSVLSKSEQQSLHELLLKVANHIGYDWG
jgi:DNA-binding MarR family transcriptional regulator